MFRVSSIPTGVPQTSHTERNHLLLNENDPFDRTAPIRLMVPQLIESRTYMRSIREFKVPADAIAVWFLGQNGFLVKSVDGPLIGIDLYLTNSCAAKFMHLPFRLDRQLPIFIEPEDLDIDVFLCTHSHDDHADPETIRRVQKHERTRFMGPFEAVRVFQENGVAEADCALLHPGETVAIGAKTTVQATFALPTDASDLNHTGMLLRFSNGLTFYNSGDTAYTDRLPILLPHSVDVCAICINGNFHNLAPTQAATIVDAICPRVVVPCHYDMMVNNVGCPEMLQVALALMGSSVAYVQMKYYEPWVYQRSNYVTD